MKGAKERGIICDMIVGSGWPFGGEFLTKEDQTQMVTIETIDLEGGESHLFNIKELLRGWIRKFTQGIKQYTGSC